MGESMLGSGALIPSGRSGPRWDNSHETDQPMGPPITDLALVGAVPGDSASGASAERVGEQGGWLPARIAVGILSSGVGRLV